MALAILPQRRTLDEFNSQNLKYMGFFGDLLKGVGEALSEAGNDPHYWYTTGKMSGLNNDPRQTYKFRAQGLKPEFCEAWDKGYEDGLRESQSK